VRVSRNVFARCGSYENGICKLNVILDTCLLDLDRTKEDNVRNLVNLRDEKIKAN